MKYCILFVLLLSVATSCYEKKEVTKSLEPSGQKLSIAIDHRTPNASLGFASFEDY